MGKRRGGHDQGREVIDHGKVEERSTHTVSGGGTLSRAPMLRLITSRNQFHVEGLGGIESNYLDESFQPIMNRVPLIKAGCGRGWARHCTRCTPGNPTTLSKIFSRSASTVSCSKHYASQPDGLRTARQSVVGTERSVGICSILLNDCLHDHRLAQVARASVRIEVKTT